MMQIESCIRKTERNRIKRARCDRMQVSSVDSAATIVLHFCAYHSSTRPLSPSPFLFFSSPLTQYLILLLASSSPPLSCPLSSPLTQYLILLHASSILLLPSSPLSFHLVHDPSPRLFYSIPPLSQPSNSYKM